MRIVYKFKSSRLQVLHKNICSENYGEFSWKHQCWGPVLIKLQGLSLHQNRNPPQLLSQKFYRTVILLHVNSCFCNQPIFAQILVHISNSFQFKPRKCYCCSQLYIIIGIYYVAVLLSLCFTCRLQIMQNDNADLI